MSSALAGAQGADLYGSLTDALKAFVDPNTGLTSFPTLLVPLGGLSEGMGTAYSAVALDSGFIDYNPAASSLLKDSELALYHHSWIADSNLEGVVYTVRFNDLGIGFGGKFLYVPFPAYNEWGAKGATDYISESVGTVNVSYNFFSDYYFYGVAAGANFKVAYRSIPAVFALNQSALAVMADAGLQTSFNFLKFYNARAKNFSVGLVVKNLGVSTLADEALPHLATAGFAWSPLRPWTIAVDGDLPFSFPGEPDPPGRVSRRRHDREHHRLPVRAGRRRRERLQPQRQHRCRARRGHPRPDHELQPGPQRIGKPPGQVQRRGPFRPRRFRPGRRRPESGGPVPPGNRGVRGGQLRGGHRPLAAGARNQPPLHSRGALPESGAGCARAAAAAGGGHEVEPVDDRETLEAIDHPIPEQTLRRIPLYHQILAEMEARGEAYVSSRHLAQFFRIDDTQVRKDVSLIGYKGKPKAGYSVLGLKNAIEEFLGINYENTAILIGAGRLGSALSQYPGLAQYGLRLVAIFDSDPTRTGSVLGAFTILPMESLQRVVRSFDVGIAIICVPKEAAQAVAGRIVSLGIKAIWNFSPTQLTVPSDVIIRNENIALGLAILSHYLKRRKKEGLIPAEAETRQNPPQKLIDIFARHQPKREYLVQILEDAQKAFGYLSREVIGHIADFLSISRERVVEAAAFYPVSGPSRRRGCGSPSAGESRAPARGRRISWRPSPGSCTSPTASPVRTALSAWRRCRAAGCAPSHPL